MAIDFEKALSKLARKRLTEAETKRFLKCGISGKNALLLYCWQKRCIKSRTPDVRIYTYGDQYALEVEVTIDCEPPELLRQLILAALSSVAASEAGSGEKVRIEEEPGYWSVDCSVNNPEVVAAQVYDLLCEWMAGETLAASVPRRSRVTPDRGNITEAVAVE